MKQRSKKEQIEMREIQKVINQRFKISFYDRVKEIAQGITLLLLVIVGMIVGIIMIFYFGTLLIENSESLAILSLSLIIAILTIILWRKT